ncbi:amidase [Comamonas sediminis]|uniref:amidase n=1 Tax=Comamonas sediminis TaxID=1783360 RepID=UPI003D2B95CD
MTTTIDFPNETTLSESAAAAQGIAASLAFASAREQLQALADGRVSAVELLEQALARIERHDGELNAIPVRAIEQARRDAQAADAALQWGERKPLLGLPITVKENFDVAGLPTTVGNPDYRSNIARQDAPAVAALRAAGAVLIGKSNVPLALSDLQSYNAVYGSSNNPWDLQRTPGGSSGGSAAAVAAGFVALELGTDIGGSVRIPAHFNGVFGHKTSYGLISMRGTGAPQGRFAARDLSVAGPLARTALDLELALAQLLNLDPLQAKGWQASLPPPRHQRLQDFRVLVLGAWPGQEASLSEQLVIARVVSALQAQGVQTTQWRDLPPAQRPDLSEQHRTYRSLLGSSVAHGAPLTEAQQQRLAELEPDDRSAEAALLRAPSLPHATWLQDNEHRHALSHQWEQLFKDYDVVLTPVAPTPAFAHQQQGHKEERRFPVAYADGVRHIGFRELFYWAGLPVLPGLPATSFPVGLDDDGLPISAQVVGPYLEDRTTIAFAHAWEQAQGGFVVPPRYAQGDA